MTESDILKLTKEVKIISKQLNDLRSYVNRLNNTQELFNLTHFHATIGVPATPIPLNAAEISAIRAGLNVINSVMIPNYNNIVVIETNQIKLQRQFNETEKTVNENIKTLNSVNDNEQGG